MLPLQPIFVTQDEAAALDSQVQVLNNEGNVVLELPEADIQQLVEVLQNAEVTRF